MPRQSLPTHRPGGSGGRIRASVAKTAAMAPEPDYDGPRITWPLTPQTVEALGAAPAQCWGGGEGGAGSVNRKMRTPRHMCLYSNFNFSER